MVNPKGRRTLEDLRVVGRVAWFEDPEGGDPVVIWMQKLNPAEHEKALRRANAARARARLTFQDLDSVEYLSLVDGVEMQFPTLDAKIAALITEDRAKIETSIESELLLGEDSEWAKDGYIIGLRDEWENVGRDLYIEDENDPVARRILDEFSRFNAAMDALIKPQLDDLRDQYKAMAASAPERFQERLLENVVAAAITSAWYEEFVRSEVWLACRLPCDECEAEARLDAADEPVEKPHRRNHKGMWFESRDAVDAVEDADRAALIDIYSEMTTPPSEGKGLPGNPASSNSSASSEPQETEPASSLTAASA